MRQNNSIFSGKYFILFLKLIIFVFALWFIYIKVFRQERAEDFFKMIREAFLNPEKQKLLITASLLMFVNWAVEAIKWRMMMQPLEKISFLKSYEAVFSGITVSFFTPNRVGEFAGRVFHLAKADRVQASLITIVGSLAQLIITVITGSVSLLVYMPHHSGFSEYIILLLSVLVIILNIFFLLLFLNIAVIEKWIEHFSFLKKIKKHIHIVSSFSTGILIKALLISLLRFFIFSSQFILLLTVFDVNASWYEELQMISLTYFVMAIVPTFFLTELASRGAVSLFFLGLLSANETGIVTASFSLWLLNLAIPALIGAVMVFMFRIERAKRT